MKGILKNKIIAVLTTICVLLGVYKQANTETLLQENGEKNSLNNITTPVASMPEKPFTGKIDMKSSKKRLDDDNLVL